MEQNPGLLPSKAMGHFRVKGRKGTFRECKGHSHSNCQQFLKIAKSFPQIAWLRFEAAV